MTNKAWMGRIKTMLGGDALNRSYYAFLLVHTSFLISNRLPGVFINTLLLGESNDVGVVMLYNMVFFLSGAVAMLFAAHIMHKTSAGTVAVIGVMGYNALYLALVVILLSGGQATNYYIWLGVLTGLADGFYWLSYGTLLSDTTEMENRDSGMAIVSVSTSVVNLCIPLLAGALISAIGNTAGYLTVFGLAFAVSAVTSALALRLPKSRHINSARVDYRYTLGVVSQNKRLLSSLLGQGCKGIREGAFTFVLSILLFQLISSEALIGVNTFVSAVVSIFSYALMSRILTRTNRVRYMLVAVTALTFMAVACLLRLDVWMIFLFTVVNAFFCGFIENSCYTTFLDMLQEDPKLEKHRPEMFALNEASLVLGRSVGIVIFLVMAALLDDTLSTQMLSLVVLVASQFITVALCKVAMRETKKEGLTL